MTVFKECYPSSHKKTSSFFHNTNPHAQTEAGFKIDFWTWYLIKYGATVCQRFIITNTVRKEEVTFTNHYVWFAKTPLEPITKAKTSWLYDQIRP